MAAPGAARILGCFIPWNGTGASSVRAAARMVPVASRMLGQHPHLPSLASSPPPTSFSSIVQTKGMTSSSRAMHSCGCVFLSAPRGAEHHDLQHHEEPKVVPRYTDDIPEIYYKYGAFKDLKSGSSLLVDMLKLGGACFFIVGLTFLNDVWSCNHWRFKHRLAGSYMEDAD